MAPKILLVANTGWYLYNFRLPLARFLRDRGVEVVLVSPPDRYVERLQSEGFRWIEIGLQRSSINPARELLVVAELAQLYRREKPSAVHHFTIKCVLYGTLAAKLSGVRAVVNAVTGLGSLFLRTSWKSRLLFPVIIPMYRTILSARRVRVVFQNPDDLQAFVDSRLVVPDRTVLIRSSGVNLQRFAPRPGDPDAAPAPVVLFVARLTREKGIYEFVEAARILRGEGEYATFQVVGDPDPGNPSSVDKDTLERWRLEGAVDFLGHHERIEEIMSQARMVVLPSYREGVPRVLLEAAAMRKPAVATDVPGCREAVINEESGLLVPVRDADALAGAIRRLLHDPELCDQMGHHGRELVEREYDDRDVARRTAQVYRAMGAI